MARVTSTTTEAGDTWDALALRLLGDERYFNELVLANPSYAYLVRLPAGIVLTVPSVPDDDEAAANLPPWMQP